MEGDQAGKEITIFTGADLSKTPEKWCMILSEITVQLVVKNVLPGEHAQSHGHKMEYQLGDNLYFTCRYQHAEEVNTSSAELGKMKLDEPENPYAKMDMSYSACLERIGPKEKSIEASNQLEIGAKKI